MASDELTKWEYAAWQFGAPRQEGNMITRANTYGDAGWEMVGFFSDY
jgi:hypothetical protein